MKNNGKLLGKKFLDQKNNHESSQKSYDKTQDDLIDYLEENGLKNITIDGNIISVVTRSINKTDKKKFGERIKVTEHDQFNTFNPTRKKISDAIDKNTLKSVTLDELENEGIIETHISKHLRVKQKKGK